MQEARKDAGAHEVVLGCSTLGLPPLEDPDYTAYAIETLFTKAPYKLIEIHLDETLPKPFDRERLFPARISDRFRRVAEAAHIHGATVFLGFGGRHLLGPRKHRPTLFEEDEDARLLRLRLVSEGLELAAEVGARGLIFLAGPSELALDPGKHSTPDWERLIRSFEQLVRRAEELDVILAPEGHGRHLFAGIADLKLLRQTIDSPMLGFTADTVHQALVEQERSLEEVYAEAAPLITHVQLDYATRLPTSWDEPIRKGSLLDAPMGRPRLGDVLVRNGWVTGEDLSEILRDRGIDDEQLAERVVEAGLCTPELVRRARAQQEGIGVVDVDGAYRGLVAGGYRGGIALESFVRDVPEVDPLEYARALGRYLAARYRMRRR